MINIDLLGKLFKRNRTERDFNKIYNSCKGPVISFLRKKFMTFTPEELNEIYNKLMMKVWTKIDQFDNEKNFSNWMFQIGLNFCKQKLWEDKREIRKIHNESNKLSFDSNDSIIQNKIWKNLSDMNEFEIQQEILEKDNHVQELYNSCLDKIDSMHLLYKPVFIDAMIHGMKHKDIAAKYGIQISTVKNRVHMGKKIIKKSFQTV